MNERRNRGVRDILIAVVDGLKGFPEAITAAFPETTVQTCIVHLIRHSMNFCRWKDRKAVAADLRPIYEAPTAEEAARQLNAFEEKWAGTYPSIAPAWRRAWAEVTPFHAFSAAIRTIIHTTNAVVSLNRTRRENSPSDCFLTSPYLQPRGAVHDHDFRSLQVALVEVIQELAPGRGALAPVQRENAPLAPFLAASFLMDNGTFCPSRRTPIAASTEMLVAFRSSRVRMTVPSRSEASNAIRPRERPNADDIFLSQAAGRPGLPVHLHLAQGPAEHVLADGPSNSPNSARLTRRVLVSAR